MLKSYNNFIKRIGKINDINESAPRIPNSEDYWTKKGKIGKKVMIYFHDDLDGIYSATAMKNYLEGKGFEIEGYGIVNYQEGWTTTVLDPQFINIALDYAENVDGIDVYMDHHGHFEEGENKTDAAVKTATSSAYEGIMDQLGLPVDSTILNIIDMVDSAKYDHYDVDIKQILDFDVSNKKNKLEFAAAFNQLLKRSDHKTFIEVVANSKDISPSIYNVFRLFRLLYPSNNLDNRTIKQMAKAYGFEKENDKGKIVPDVEAFLKKIKQDNPKLLRDFEKDFINDAEWRLGQMEKRTRGWKTSKYYVDSQDKFKELFVTKSKARIDKATGESKGGNPKVELPGYQIIGNMCFVPSGTWANALRARAVLETDLLDDERIPIIDYRVLKTSKLYSELLQKDGETLELVGDISGMAKNEDGMFVPVDKSEGDVITFSPELDVTNDDKVEGIKGEVIVKNTQVIFKAKQPIFWILLQYGNTLQVASLHSFNLYVKKYLPKVHGEPVENLGKYCEDLLVWMAKNLGYNVNLIPESTTKAGGHIGIGSISNIFGEVEPPGLLLEVPDPLHSNKRVKVSDEANGLMDKYQGARFLDLIKNQMIDDLSGIEFKDIVMPWGDPDEKPPSKPKDSDMNKKVLKKDQIRKAQDVEKQYNDWDIDDLFANVKLHKQIGQSMLKYVDEYDAGDITAEQLRDKIDIDNDLKKLLKKLDHNQLENFLTYAKKTIM